MKKYLFLTLLTTLFMSGCESDPHTYVIIETEYGEMEMMLYNSTPIHRDNFIKLVNEQFYDSLLFHRVIPGFMIQGGDPDSKNAAPGAMLGMGGPGYQLEAEIGAPHIRGAVAAARTQNPQKKSSGSQFYIVQGQQVTDAALDSMERQKGIKYNEAQRQLYKEQGGTPMLDGDYTVFAEIVKGFEVIDQIAGEQRDGNDRPVKDVWMKIRMK